MQSNTRKHWRQHPLTHDRLNWIVEATDLKNRMSIVLSNLNQSKTCSESEMMLFKIMSPCPFHSTKEVQPSIDSFMTGIDGVQSTFLLSGPAVVYSEDLIITSIALVASYLLPWCKLWFQERSEESQVMDGSSNRTNKVANVSSYNVWTDLVLETKMVMLVSVPLLSLSEGEFVERVCLEVFTINVQETFLIAIPSNESVGKADLRRSQVRVHRSTRQSKTTSTHHLRIKIGNGFNVKPRPLPEGLFIASSQSCKVWSRIIELEKQQRPKKMDWIWWARAHLVVNQHAPNNTDNDRIDSKERVESLKPDPFASRPWISS